MHTFTSTYCSMLFLISQSDVYFYQWQYTSSHQQWHQGFSGWSGPDFSDQSGQSTSRSAQNPFHGVQQKPSLSPLLSPIVFTVGKVDLFSWRWWPKLGRRECDGGAWLVISRLAPYGAHDSPARSYARMLARMLPNLAQQFMGLSVQRKTRVLICSLSLKSSSLICWTGLDLWIPPHYSKPPWSYL